MTSQVTLLWHSLYLNGPIIGLCEYEGQKMVFKRVGDDYATSVLELYTLKEEELKVLEEAHESNRKSVGGINDYGKAFGQRAIHGKSGVLLKGYPYPSDLTVYATVEYSQITNPYQCTKI